MYFKVNLQSDGNFIKCDLQVHKQIHWNFIFCRRNSEKEEPKYLGKLPLPDGTFAVSGQLK